MKKILSAVLAVVFCLLAQSALAGTYTVKKGDCLAKIGRHSGVAWQKIAKANNLKAPYIIYPGQKLKILPAATAAVVETTTVSTETTARETLIRELKAEIAELEEKLSRMSSSSAATSSVSEAKKEEAAVEKTEVKTAKASAEIPAKAETPAVVVSASASGAATAAKSRVASSAAANDQFDLYMTGGGWKLERSDASNSGTYGNAKLRYRPFNSRLFGHEVGLGGFLLGETGSGSSGNYDFRWDKFAIGPTMKVYGRYWDATTELGWARQWDHGSSSKQLTDSIHFLQYVNLEQRRRSGQQWFPQTELALYGAAPFSAAKENTRTGQSMAADNKSIFGLDIRQSIYDFRPGENTKLVPGVLLGVGQEATDAFGKLGAFVKWRVYEQDILMLETSFRKRSGVDGYRWYGSLMVSPSGIVKAYQAASITQATAADLKAN